MSTIFSKFSALKLAKAGDNKSFVGLDDCVREEV